MLGPGVSNFFCINIMNNDTSELRRMISKLTRPKKEQKEPKVTKQYFEMKRKTKSK